MNLTEFRRLAVPHQKPGECKTCDGRMRKMVAAVLGELYGEPTWRCGVFDSGYHNGCKCNPSGPHDGWNCGYAYRAPQYGTDWWNNA